MFLLESARLTEQRYGKSPGKAIRQMDGLIRRERLREGRREGDRDTMHTHGQNPIQINIRAQLDNNLLPNESRKGASFSEKGAARETEVKAKASQSAEQASQPTRFGPLNRSVGRSVSHLVTQNLECWRERERKTN